MRRDRWDLVAFLRSYSIVVVASMMIVASEPQDTIGERCCDKTRTVASHGGPSIVDQALDSILQYTNVHSIMHYSTTVLKMKHHTPIATVAS